MSAKTPSELLAEEARAYLDDVKERVSTRYSPRSMIAMNGAHAMNSPHFSFDDDEPRSTKEGPTFSVAGESYRCVAEAPGGTIERIAQCSRLDDRGRQVFSAPDLVAFFEGVIIEEELVEGVEQGAPDEWRPVDDLDRFRAAIASKRKPITIQKLGDIFTKLVEHYTARPTGRP